MFNSPISLRVKAQELTLAHWVLSLHTCSVPSLTLSILILLVLLRPAGLLVIPQGHQLFTGLRVFYLKVSPPPSHTTSLVRAPSLF